MLLTSGVQHGCWFFEAFYLKSRESELFEKSGGFLPGYSKEPVWEPVLLSFCREAHRALIGAAPRRTWALMTEMSRGCFSGAGPAFNCSVWTCFDALTSSRRSYFVRASITFDIEKPTWHMLDSIATRKSQYVRLHCRCSTVAFSFSITAQSTHSLVFTILTEHALNLLELSGFRSKSLLIPHYYHSQSSHTRLYSTSSSSFFLFLLLLVRWARWCWDRGCSYCSTMQL